MPQNITDEDTFTTQVQAPQDSEPANVASIITTFVQAFANRTKWLYNRLTGSQPLALLAQLVVQDFDVEIEEDLLVDGGLDVAHLANFSDIIANTMFADFGGFSDGLIMPAAVGPDADATISPTSGQQILYVPALTAARTYTMATNPANAVHGNWCIIANRSEHGITLNGALGPGTNLAAGTVWFLVYFDTGSITGWVRVFSFADGANAN